MTAKRGKGWERLWGRRSVKQCLELKGGEQWMRRQIEKTDSLTDEITV